MPITGISGFLGNQFVQMENKNFRLVGTYHSKSNRLPGIETHHLDIQNKEEVKALIELVKPDMLVHLAALSNSNFCEKNEDLSFSVNVLGSENIARICQSQNIPFLFTSTDLVFDGEQAPYTPAVIPKPICIYGKHKIEAEQKILSIYPEAIIARCPLMYGFAGVAANFLSSWVATLRKGESIGAFTDEFRTAVSGAAAVEGILLLLEKQVEGIWHLGGKERSSRYDFAMQVAEVFGLNKALIEALKQKDIPMPAARPADVSLDSSASFALGYNPPESLEELKRIKKSLSLI